MNRLQKKCFIGSAGIHLLLFVILLIGPAFLSSKQKAHPIDNQTLNFFPSKVIDAAFAGGGNPNAKPPPAAPPLPVPPAQPPPQAAVEKVREPDVPKPEKPSKIDPDSVEPKTTPKPYRPQISTTMVTRKADEPKAKTKPSDSDAKAQQQQLADARRKLGQQFAKAADNIGRSTSTITTIEDFGPGGGGTSYANYAAKVKKIYEDAWQEPDDATTDDAIAKVTVTIGSDGHVFSSQISRPSGDSQVDRSVQRALDRVRFIGPFPEGAKEKQRTYIIHFNLRAKRGLA
jgi:TonB family protein